MFYATNIVQQYSSNEVSTDGWVTTRVAAAALGVKPQKIRNYIASGELEAITEGEGTKRRYLVSISSLENLYAKRHSEGKLPGQNRDSAERLVASEQEEAPILVRELVAELGEGRYRLGQAEARLELMAEAESALRAQLQRERERADRLETERERLLPDLMREKDRVNAERERAEHLEAQLREALEVRRGWFRRFFGF